MNDVELDERLGVEFERLAGTYRPASADVVAAAVAGRVRARRTRHRVLATATAGVAALVIVGAVVVVRDPTSPKVTVNVIDGSSAPGWTRLDPGPLAGSRQGQVELVAGGELFFWGGAPNDGAQRFADGAVFDPRTSTWRNVPPSPLAARRDAVGVWTGSEILVWGGDGHTDGAAYNPTSKSWRTLAASPLDGSLLGGAVWTGTEMVVVTADGSAAYDPATDQWRDLGTPPVTIEPTTTTSMVWTGEVVVILASAATAQLDPSALGWIRAEDAPLVPNATSAAWDGERVVAWSYSNQRSNSPGAAAYHPEADDWMPLPDLPVPIQECYPATTPIAGGLVAGFCEFAARWDTDSQQWSALDVPVRQGEAGGPYLLRPGLVVGDDVYYWGESTFWVLRPGPVPTDAPTNPLALPNVVGLTAGEAQQVLERLGTTGAAPGGDPQSPTAVVVAQEPGAGSVVARGTTVGLRTALINPALCAVMVDGANADGDALALIASPGFLDMLGRARAVADLPLSADISTVVDSVERGAPDDAITMQALDRIVMHQRACVSSLGSPSGSAEIPGPG